MSLSDPEANTQLLNSTHLSSQGWASSKALFCEQNKINVDHKHAWHVDPWSAVFHARILVLKSNQDQGQVLNLIPAKLMFWCAFAHDTEKIPKKVVQGLVQRVQRPPRFLPESMRLLSFVCRPCLVLFVSDFDACVCACVRWRVCTRACALRLCDVVL